MKKLLSIAAVAALLLTGCAKNPDAEMDKFIDALMKKMTLEEKAGQLELPAGLGTAVTGEFQSGDAVEPLRKGLVGGFLNIMNLEQMRELQRVAVEESPNKIPLIFGMDVIHGFQTTFPIPLGMTASWNPELVERASRIAAIEASASGICWTYSPMVDISHDPRWGRVAEGVGEDPYLGGLMGAAMVRGYQGDGSYDDPSYIMSCVKHYALYGAAEGGRDYNTVDMSKNRMYNEYFGPYKATVEAGVGSVMASFNEINGTPAHANGWLMNDVLRDEWGFDGFVVTDYTGIMELGHHGLGDERTVTKRAIEAGIDFDMVSGYFVKYLPELVRAGEVDEALVDQACRRMLEAKYKLGLFEDPYRFFDDERAKQVIFTEEHQAASRQAATESFVLLKNDNNTLPLAKKGTIAVVGPLADAPREMLGPWSLRGGEGVSVVDGIRNAVEGKAKVVYAPGSKITLDDVAARNYGASGAGIQAMTVDPSTLNNDAMVREAVRVSRSADVIVAVVGEIAGMSGESASRSNIDMPDAQKILLRELKKLGKPIVMVLFNGRAMSIVEEDAAMDAILDVWFPGSMAGYAVADVLFGDVNPSGKLPSTFPRTVGQLPMAYNHKNTGRPLPEGGWYTKFRSNYMDVVNEPLYPFGYGLSYTTFEYGDLTLSAEEISAQQTVTASITVKNTGKVAGEEVVQMYIRDLVGSITRPVKELKGFEKISLQPGESKTVEFVIDNEMLSFYNDDLVFGSEPGEFSVMVGTNSRDVVAKNFVLK